MSFRLSDSEPSSSDWQHTLSAHKRHATDVQDEKPISPTSHRSHEQDRLHARIAEAYVYFDHKISRWALVFILLAALALTALISLILTVCYSPHYAIAISSAAFLLSTLFSYSFLIYCRDEGELLASNIEARILDILDKEGVHQSERRGDLIMKGAVHVKNRWSSLFPLKGRWYDFLYSRILHPLLRLYLWIPYSLLAEKLFHTAKECYIQGIRQEPKNMKLHAGLANTYVTLSNHLKEASAMSKLLPFKGRYIPGKMVGELLLRRDFASRRAIQELLILRSFAPEELWVLDQLAISFRELGMIEQEIEIYEAILRVHAEDTNAIFRLGLLSFARGDNARGLEMYDQLLYLQPLLAQELIASFGAYDLEREKERVLDPHMTAKEK